MLPRCRNFSRPRRDASTFVSIPTETPNKNPVIPIRVQDSDVHNRLPCTSVSVKSGWIRIRLEMWANAQRDGRPVEYRWCPLFNVAVWPTPTTRVLCSNAVKTRNSLKLPGVPQTNETISAASGPKFTILWGHVEEILLLNRFFPIVDSSLI